MTLSDPQQIRWQVKEGFWTWHLLVPLLCAACTLLLLEKFPVDLWLADQWWALEGHRWALRNNWFTAELIHHRGKQLVIALGLVLLVLVILSHWIHRLRRWRLPMIYVVASMALLPGLIALGKHFSEAPCPWDLHRYGGSALYRHNFAHQPDASQGGQCFPAGHASAGFALLAVYFAALPFARRPAPYLVPGLLLGSMFALGQQARGAHFISHDLWTLSLCWFGALVLFFLFRPGRWPGPGRDITRSR